MTSGARASLWRGGNANRHNFVIERVLQPTRAACIARADPPACPRADNCPRGQFLPRREEKGAVETAPREPDLQPSESEPGIEADASLPGVIVGMAGAIASIHPVVADHRIERAGGRPA